MSTQRLLRPDVVAFVAALALLFVMAADWYGTNVGDEARRIEKLSQPHGALGGEVEREVQKDARFIAQGQEKNAWQVPGAIDRVILVLLLATVVLAVAAAFLRMAGRRFQPPLTPSALAALTATVTALLVTYRILQEPGFDEATTVKSGAPLALVTLAVIALGGVSALRREEAGTAWIEPSSSAGAEPAGEGGPAG